MLVCYDLLGYVLLQRADTTRVGAYRRRLMDAGKDRQQKHRRRPGGWRIAAAGGAAALAALIALPATGAVGQAAASTTRPTSSPPISRVLNGKVAAASVIRTSRALGSTAE